MKNYYESIDELPLYNWLKINDGQIEYCRRNINEGSDSEDIFFCDKINDSYYLELGVDAELIRVLDLQKELAEFRLNWIITGDNFLKNTIVRLEVEIEELLDRKKGGGDFGETIIRLSKWVGYRLDIRLITVKEFYNIVSLFKKEVAKTKKINEDGSGKNN